MFVFELLRIYIYTLKSTYTEAHAIHMYGIKSLDSDSDDSNRRTTRHVSSKPAVLADPFSRLMLSPTELYPYTSQLLCCRYGP